MKNFIATFVALLCFGVLSAQPHMNVSIQNMHLWRGGEVADGMVITTELYYADASERFKIGFWGGSNTAGEYKEFNYFASCTLGNLHLALADTYNFSEYADYNNKEFFNYSSRETGRFLDARVKYTISDNVPILLGWSTVIFGRDRDVSNSGNRYSTFCSISYPIYNQNHWRVDARVGGAFALDNIDHSANFYGSQAGIVEASLKVSNRIKIKNYEIPLYLLMMWNPQSNQAYMQLYMQVINF